MKRAFFDKTSRNIVQKVVILCDFHVTETYGHIIVTRKYCIFMQDVVILHSKIRDKRWLALENQKSKPKPRTSQKERYFLIINWSLASSTS